MLSFSYAANRRAVIVKCDGCAYDVDVDEELEKGSETRQLSENACDPNSGEYGRVVHGQEKYMYGQIRFAVRKIRTMYRLIA